jgi:hypothetical protein
VRFWGGLIVWAGGGGLVVGGGGGGGGGGGKPLPRRALKASGAWQEPR